MKHRRGLRVAYIGPYKGPGLLATRPTVSNLGLALNLKMELIAELLRRVGHQVDIISQGEVVERRARLYRGFSELNPCDETVPVFYASALPIKHLNGLWATAATWRIFRRRHRERPYDVAVVYNLKLPQVMCGLYALRRLRLPVVLEYEDDSLVDLAGNAVNGNGIELRLARRLLSSVSGCIGVSPHLLTRVPKGVPKLLLRGVVSENVMRLGSESGAARRDWIVYSGTHASSKGLEQLIIAWGLVDLRGWELHIAGYGEKTDALKRMAEHQKGVVFDGLLNREENARLLSRAKIGMNPHDVSVTPGNVFAFKIIEYLAAGTHVITTPMGPVERSLEAGMTYIPDNRPETIASALERVVSKRAYERLALQAAQALYGPEAVSRALAELVTEVTGTPARS